MKKNSILLMLLIGLFMPWAANAHETKVINGVAVNSPTVGEKGGARGTMKVYKLVTATTLTSGKNYLIVSSQTANTNAYALSQTSSNITASSVHINAGDQFCNTVYINSDGLEPTAVWKANSGWTFQNGSTSKYLYCNRSLWGSVSLQASSSSQNWTYSSNTLYWQYSGLFSNTNYYITYNNGFTVGTSSANVYLYEETDLTVFDITATASPSGIGTVTGAGRYLNGANCTLTASTDNSEFVFTNWTLNGTEVSTNPTYSFTVEADQNYVANFESTVSCNAPTNLSVTNESITAHSAALNWTENGEATQWEVVYSTDANFDPDGATPTLVNSNPYTITELAQSTTYYAYVRAYCDATSQSSWSNQATFSTIAGNQPPTNLTLGTPDAHGNTLSWTGMATNTNHQNFEVYYSTTNTAPSDDITSGYEVVNANSCTLSDLTQETTYYAWVRDNCGTDGKSAWAAFNVFSTIAGNQPPTNLTLGTPDAHSNTLSWTGVATNVNHQNFEVFYSTTNSAPSDDITSGYEVVNATSCTLSDLAPETTYYAWVRDNCGTDGKSAWVAFNAFTTGIACFAPGLTYSDVESHTVQLTFSGSTDTYNVRFAELVLGPAIQATEDFSGNYSLASYNANGELPTGWVGVKTGTYLPHVSSNTTLGNSYKISGISSNTDQFLYMVNASTAIMPLYSNITAVSFQYCYESASRGTFTVGYCTENTSGTSFTALTNNGNSFTPGTTSLTTVTLTEDAIATINAHNGYLAFNWTGVTNYGLAVDNISITYQPLIPDTWTYRNDVTDNPYILSGLSPETNYQVEAQAVCGGIDGNSQWSDPVTFTTLIACPAPTNLTNGTPGTRSVTLSWTENGTATNWQVEYATNSDFSDSFTIPVSTNPSTELTDLIPETTYYARVIAVCGGIDGESVYSNTVTFTTEIACPAPYNVTASNLTLNSAHISWDGDADSYNVQYRTATITGTTQNEIFSYGFENGLTGWTTYANGFSGSITDWQQYDATSLGTNYNNTNHGGSYVVRSKSYAGSSGGDVTVDNWLVSPQMTLGDVLTFWVSDDGTWHEHLEVWVSTGTNAISDFVKVATPDDAESAWTMRTVDLSAYAGQQGYIAIRNNDTGKDYILVDDFTVYETINSYSYGTLQTLPPTSENSCSITGLSPETLYEVQVQADCGTTQGTSSWRSVYFTTPDACSAPTDLVSSNITTTEATLEWADNQDSYNVRYREVYFYEDFEEASLPADWTTIDANNDGNTWSIGFATSHSGDNGAYNLSYIYNTTGTTPDDYLVSPQLNLQGTLRVWLSGYGDRYADHFAIYVSTTGNSAADFTTTLVGETTTTDQYVEYTADLSSYDGALGYIAIRHFNCSDQNYLYVDDFGLYGSEDWVSVNPNPTEATLTLTDLRPNTGYEWQVQGLNCNIAGSATDWSAIATFTTSCPTYTKIIESVGEEDWDNGNSGYYLIASPLAGDVNPATITGMTTGDYDLYSFNQAEDLEWQNYRTSTFNLINGQGYLYASKEGTTLTFAGAPYIGTTKTVTLSKTDEAAGLDFPDWNLVGNPFTEDAYLSDNRAFYSMQNSGDFTPESGSVAIGAMEGVFVIAETDGEPLTFTTAEPNSKGAQLNVNLTKAASTGSAALMDRAIVRFDEGSQLPKLQFRKGSTKVYIPLEGKDYAVVRSEEMGTMPVNFKAENNGSYTLSFTTEEVSFSYLHLIDNMTGNDVDLLANPSYSFNAKTTDYESRFKLVFATGNNSNDDTFAFYSNGSFVINNESEATLQVIDVNGRILKSESINGCANVNVNAAQGIYMLRLINGNDVKVQKVVVK